MSLNNIIRDGEMESDTLMFYCVEDRDAPEGAYSTVRRWLFG